MIIASSAVPAENLPFQYKVAIGAIGGVSCINKFGFNNNIGGTFEDIWSRGGDIHYPSNPSVASVVSDSADDNSAGSGSSKIRIKGLDANGILQEEDIALTGLVPVLTTKVWGTISRAIVTEMGAANTNGLSNGTISFTVDGGVCAEIPENMGHTESAMYTIPSDEEGYILGFQISSPKADDASCEVLVRASRTGPWAVKMRITINAAIHTGIPIVPFGPYPPGSDIRWRAQQVGGGSVDISLQQQILTRKI